MESSRSTGWKTFFHPPDSESSGSIPVNSYQRWLKNSCFPWASVVQTIEGRLSRVCGEGVLISDGFENS
jgi:hypothetical protein